MTTTKNKFGRGHYIRQALKLVDNPNVAETERVLVLARQLAERQEDKHTFDPACVKREKHRLRRAMNCTLLSKAIIEQWEQQHPASKSDRPKQLNYTPAAGYAIPEPTVAVKSSELKAVAGLLRQLGGKERLLQIAHLVEELLK